MSNKERPKSLRKPLTPYEREGGTYGDFMRVIEKKRQSEADESVVKALHETISPIKPDSESNSQHSAEVKKIALELDI